MNDNSNFFFWGFLACIIGIFIGYSHGEENQKKIHRDEEMEELKRQIKEMKYKGY